MKNHSVVLTAIGALTLWGSIAEAVNPALAVTSGQLACKKNRYISFQTNNPGAEVAFEVQRTLPSPMTGYAGPPDGNDASGVYPTPVFRSDWPAILSVGDCEIIPVADYSVRVIPGPPPGGTPSAALALQTIAQPSQKFFGDTTGGLVAGAWDCPNGVTGANDFQMAIQKWLGVATAPHLTMANVQAVSSTNPCLNNAVNIADVYLILQAFQGLPYPFYVCSGNGKSCSNLGATCPTVPGDAAGTGVCEGPNTTNCPPNTGSPNCPP